jgi:hypothetical protein
MRAVTKITTASVFTALKKDEMVFTAFLLHIKEMQWLKTRGCKSQQNVLLKIIEKESF